MQRRLLLHSQLVQRHSFTQRLASKHEPLRSRWQIELTLDDLLDVPRIKGGLHVDGERLAVLEGLDVDLHGGGALGLLCLRVGADFRLALPSVVAAVAMRPTLHTQQLALAWRRLDDGSSLVEFPDNSEI